LGLRRDQTTPTPRDPYGRQTHHGDLRLIYDDAHRLIMVIQDNKNARTQAEDNHLTNTIHPNNNKLEASNIIARYRYDAMGNRIAKTVQGHTTYFIYDTAHQLVAEANEHGRITRQYLYADHRP
jgi:YD repeat-containing protein